MNALRMKQRALARAQPLNVHLELTYRCNWRCVFCYNPRHGDLAPLTRDEWISVLDELRVLGTLTLTLTGGEPLAHPHFFEIARAARARAFALRIFTNATLISAASDVAALAPIAVEVSIHGATAAVHDATTGIRGSFARTLAGIDRLVSSGVRVVLKTPLTNLNEHEIDGLASLAQERGLALQIDPHITPRDDGDRGPLRFAASPAAIRHAMEVAGAPSSERTPGGYNCGIGRITMAIDPEGNVFPCMQWRVRSLGNVRAMPLREMWRASAVRAEAAGVSIAANDALLAAGGAMAEFPYCPALAMQETGDPLVPDASFRMRAEIAASLR